ncbi:MAG: class I SAM-dependent methyltransferase [Staphylothermus sp.]|nr:class I SAM-dependent methyltransferase [Staphylothermus sp.]
MNSLEKLYALNLWPMDPEDPVAIKRFEDIVSIFRYLYENHDFFEEISKLNTLRIIDLMAGTGIAGAAIAKSLVGLGITPELTLVDIRRSDLEKVYQWLRKARIEDKVKVEIIESDIRELYLTLEDRKDYYDIALIWGSSAPHLNAWDMVKAYSNISYLLKPNGLLLMEEGDRVYGTFYLMGYKDFLIEGETKEGKLANIHSGYDWKRGVFKRYFCLLPGFKEIGELDLRYWDLAGLASLGWVFFKDVDIVPRSIHRQQRVASVVLFKDPRKKLVPDDFFSTPKLLRK